MSNSESLFNLALKGIQQLNPYIPGKPAEELQRELGLTQIVKLASNENPLGSSPKALIAVQNALTDLARYPDGSGFGLKSALARKLKVDTAQITLGNGSDEILSLIARTFLNPNLNIVISQHAFAMYAIAAQTLNAKIIITPAINYGYDLNAMLAAINPQTRIVFIANPNNPTGTLLSQTELKTFIGALPKTVLCVLDEAYFEYRQIDSTEDSIDWLAKFSNLIITRTFSKAYGLAGLRVGYGISSAIVADLLNRVRPPFNNNSLALAAAEAALQDTAHLQKSIQINQAGMMQLTNAFQELNLEWIPSAGNFVTVNLQQPALPIYQALLQKGVIVRPVANYELPNHLRISIGTEVENQTFIEALTQVLNCND
jgi:histidinol-phosphate aminotransferase